MASTSLNHSFDMIERALERLERQESAGGFSAKAEDKSAEHAAEMVMLARKHENALEERDRTIASLRSDLASVEREKSEELSSLRTKVSEQQRTIDTAPPSTKPPSGSETQYQHLLRKHRALEATAKKTLQKLDALIESAKAGQA